MYFDAYFAYFCYRTAQLQFENLVFVIMSTRENTRLIARASYLTTGICKMVVLPVFLCSRNPDVLMHGSRGRTGGLNLP